MYWGESMEDDLIAWKTDAWKGPENASQYRSAMEVERGTSRLKNRVKVDLCRRYALGPNILDVGIGTGRASIPLAKEGFNVTGIDSSQDMLDLCRELAGQTPLSLRQCDLGNLVFDDNQFDTLLALNVMVHFPHWKDVLKEWKRVVRPGGRIVFDIHSLDHEEAVFRVKGLPVKPDNKEDFYNYACRVRVSEIAQVADELGIRISAVVPYAALSNINYWLKDSLAEGHRFDRLLSWLLSDYRFMDFALFLERELIQNLTSLATSRMMVVFENVPGGKSNQHWLKRNEAFNKKISGFWCLEELTDFLPGLNDDWRDRLNTYLEWPFNRVLLHFLLSAVPDFSNKIDLSSFMNERHARTLLTWNRQRELDEKVVHILNSLIKLPEMNEIFEYRKIPLAVGFQYDLTREVLTHFSMQHRRPRKDFL